jgi:hypothetical protein
MQKGKKSIFLKGRKSIFLKGRKSIFLKKNALIYFKNSFLSLFIWLLGKLFLRSSFFCQKLVKFFQQFFYVLAVLMNPLLAFRVLKRVSLHPLF